MSLAKLGRCHVDARFWREAELGRCHVDAGAVVAARGGANPGNAAGLLRAHEAGPFGIKFLISRAGP